MERVKAKAGASGRGFSLVTHPAPEAPVIEADWPIEVRPGELTI